MYLTKIMERILKKVKISVAIVLVRDKFK